MYIRGDIQIYLRQQMARCAHCKKFILGGKKEGHLRFCNDKCHQDGFLAPLAAQAAPTAVSALLEQMRWQACPVCGGEGPLDIHTVHTAWAYIVRTSWKDQPLLACSQCGTASIRRGIASTALLGWWGLAGMFVAPWQLANGFRSLARTRKLNGPSEELQRLAKLAVADEIQRTARENANGFDMH